MSLELAVIHKRKNANIINKKKIKKIKQIKKTSVTNVRIKDVNTSKMSNIVIFNFLIMDFKLKNINNYVKVVKFAPIILIKKNLRFRSYFNAI